jgi:hypothetical protein
VISILLSIERREDCKSSEIKRFMIGGYLWVAVVTSESERRKWKESLTRISITPYNQVALLEVPHARERSDADDSVKFPGCGGMGDAQADHWGLSMLKLIPCIENAIAPDTKFTRIYVPGTVVQTPLLARTKVTSVHHCFFIFIANRMVPTSTLPKLWQRGNTA